MNGLERHDLNSDGTLPENYGANKIVILARDPYYLYAYWEVTQGHLQSVAAAHGDIFGGRRILRVYNTASGTFKDIDVGNSETGNWHFQVETAGGSYMAELGELLPGGRFVPLLISNTVRTPRDSISSVIDPRFKMFAFWKQRYFRNMVIGLSSYELFIDTERRANEGVYRD